MKRVLDAGCGRGEFLQEKFSRIENIEVYGVDVSAEFIKDARRASPRHFHYKICPLERLDFTDRFFDEVHCYDLLEHVEDYPRVLRNICRVLKPGGRLYLKVPHPFCEKIIYHFDPWYCGPEMHRRVIPSQQLKQDLEKNGLKVVRCQKRMFVNALMAIYRAMRKLPVEAQSGRYLQSAEIGWIYRIFGPIHRLKPIQSLDALLAQLLCRKYEMEAVKVN